MRKECEATCLVSPASPRTRTRIRTRTLLLCGPSARAWEASGVDGRKWFFYLANKLEGRWKRQPGLTTAVRPCQTLSALVKRCPPLSNAVYYCQASIVGRVRATQPQLVMSGEGYGSWAEMMTAVRTKRKAEHNAGVGRFFSVLLAHQHERRTPMGVHCTRT